MQQGKIDEAKVKLDEAKSAYESVLPDGAYEFYELYRNYAELYSAEQKTEEAVKAYNKAMKINMALQGENHKDIADIYNQLSHLYEDIDNKKSAEYSKKAEEIYNKFCEK